MIKKQEIRSEIQKKILFLNHIVGMDWLDQLPEHFYDKLNCLDNLKLFRLFVPSQLETLKRSINKQFVEADDESLLDKTLL